MSKPKSKIEVFEGRNGWYWRCRHRNGRIVADGSEPYSTKSNARRAARRIGGTLLFAPIVEVTPTHHNGAY